MFGTYSVINIVVLLNLLIAMMNHSYQLISVSIKKSYSFVFFSFIFIWFWYGFENGKFPLMIIYDKFPLHFCCGFYLNSFLTINFIMFLFISLSLLLLTEHTQERADVEWKFARSRLWISYFEEGGTCPPPFNIIPAPKSVWYIFEWMKKRFFGRSKTIKKEHMKTIRVSLTLTIFKTRKTSSLTSAYLWH